MRIDSYSHKTKKRNSSSVSMKTFLFIVALTVALASVRRPAGRCDSGCCLPALPDLTQLPRSTP